MRKLQKIVCVFLSLALISTLLIPACAVTNTDSIEGSGVRMNNSEFEEYFYTGIVPSSSTNSVNSQPQLTISGIYYDEDSYALTVAGQVLSGQGSSKTFSLSGTLYNSYKKMDGINSMSAILDDSMNHFDVLLFNVFHSTETAPFTFNQTYKNTAHLKLYLLDRETQDLYFFETEIPQSLSNVSIPLTDDTICPDMLHDMIWFGNMIEPEMEFIPSAPQISPMSSTGTTYFNQICIQWSPAGGPYRYFTTPILVYNVGDISEDSPGVWTFYFGTSNGFMIDPTNTRYNLTAINIKDFQLALTAGTNTYFSPESSINCSLLGGGSLNTFDGLLGLLPLDEMAGAANALSILLNLISFSNDKVIFGLNSPIFSSDGDEKYGGLKVKIANHHQYIQHDFNAGEGEYLLLNCLTLRDPSYPTYTGTTAVNVNVQYTAELGVHSITSPRETARIMYSITQ